MLGNFFKPKWLHADAKVRLQAIPQLAGDGVELIKLAQTDPDTKVRVAAIAHLTHLPTLIQLGHGKDHPAEAARQRVISLAATDHHHDQLLADIFHWLQQNPTLVSCLASDTNRSIKLRRHAIEALTDQTLLFEIADRDSSKEIQFLAANQLHDLEKLKLLDKQHGKNNKRLRQLLKERLEHAQYQQQLQDRIETLCADAASLGQRGTWAQEKTRSLVLQQRWSETANHASPSQQQWFNDALTAFHNQLAQVEAEQARQIQERAAQAEEQARLQAEAAQAEEQAAQAKREQQAQEQQTQAEERRRRKQQQAQQQAILQQLHEALQTLENSLEAEQYGDAINQHQALLQQLKEAPALPSAERNFFQRRIQMLTPYIRELRDWRRWSTDQVRKQLIETAENLRTDEAIDPEQRAKRVQALRNEWQKLAHIEPGQRALWKAFDSNVTAAYEPSKQYFDAQAQQRQLHLEQRNTLCAELETLNSDTVWENPDWRALQAKINQIRKQWKQCGTVNHKEWKAVNERFNKAMDALDVHFKAERERNWQAREQLIAAATALLDKPNTAQAIEQAKALQSQWHITIAARPSDEQRLWKQFRAPIDALFARAREERDQKRAENDARHAENLRLAAEAQQREQERQQQRRAELDALDVQSQRNKQTETDAAAQAANRAAGEALCLQLEVLLDLETPAAFQKSRMEYQIAQMRDAMRSRKDTQDTTIQALDLLKSWYALGRMDDASHAAQMARIKSARAALGLE